MKEKLNILKIVSTALCALIAVVFFIKGMIAVYDTPDQTDFKPVGTYTFVRNAESETEEENEDKKVCPVEFVSEDGAYSLVKNYSDKEWESLAEDEKISGWVYTFGEGETFLTFDHEPSYGDLSLAVRDVNAVQQEKTFQIALAFLLLAVGIAVMAFWGKHFTAYEQIWFISIMLLSAVVSVICPEEDMNGFSGILIMILYLADIFLNMLCELLISKQSKWNFIVSVFVEITEIITCIVLANRFATMAVTLFFWLPIDIASFINWHCHPDRQKEELTKVRKLSGLAMVAVITGIVIWTAVVGWFLSNLDITTDLFGGNRLLETAVAYLDACASAVGIANGVFIFFRFREQWIAWYICAALESIINILSGQFVLLVLKFGYFTNSTYGYIKWTKYIKDKEKNSKEEKHAFF